MILVERLLVVGHREMAVPCFGNHHHHGVRKRAAAHDQHLERIVEDCGVAAGFVDHRQEILDVLAVDVRLELVFARLHPVDVAAQRVDFAVVRDVTERMRERPARKRVRAESLVNHGQRGFHERILPDPGNTFDLSAESIPL